MEKPGASNAERAAIIRGRSQAAKRKTSLKTGLWEKRDTSTGRFESIKKSGGSFKGVPRER